MQHADIDLLYITNTKQCVSEKLTFFVNLFSKKYINSLFYLLSLNEYKKYCQNIKKKNNLHNIISIK